MKIITRKSGANILICFAKKQYEILTRSWNDEQKKDEAEEMYRMADKFSAAPRNEIRNAKCDMSYYLSPSKMVSELDCDIPKLLLYFIEKLILTDKKKVAKNLTTSSVVPFVIL